MHTNVRLATDKTIFQRLNQYFLPYSLTKHLQLVTEVHIYLSDFKHSKQKEKVLRVLQIWINLLIKIKSKILMMFLTYDFMRLCILECFTSFTSLPLFVAKKFSDESWMISRKTCSNFISLFANTKVWLCFFKYNCIFFNIQIMQLDIFYKRESTYVEKLLV